MKRWVQLGMMLVAVAAPVCAQNKTVGDGTTASAKGEHLTVEIALPAMLSGQKGVEFWSGVVFHLEPGWHVYWVNAGDAGEPPHVQWTLPAGITMGPMQFPAPKRLSYGPLMDYGYEGTAAYPIRMAVTRAMPDMQAKEKVHVTAAVDWLVCREVCLPGKALLGSDFTFSGAPVSFSMPPMVTPVQRVILDAVKHLPKPLPAGATASVDASAGEFVLTLHGIKGSDVEVYPFDPDEIVNAAPQAVTAARDGVIVHLKKDSTLTHDPLSLHVLLKVGDAAYDVGAALSNARGAQVFTAPADSGVVATGAAPSAPVQSAGDVTLLAAVGLAFLGGIILNLMPCVFPVLFLKGLALVQGSGEERSRLRKHGVVYTLGILASFWVIVGVLLALRASGAKLGWGFQLQSPVFIAVLCVGIFFFALSLAGMFELGLTLTSAGGELAQKPGYAGSFFTGVLATVVATPCTAPLMGAAIGFALAQPGWMAFVVFTAVALGLALPYLLLSFNPAWTRLLPRPGTWMEVLKQLTAVPLFATAIWLAWVFGTLRGLDQMARLLIALLFAAMAAWVLGRWPAKWFASGIAGLLLVGGLAVPLMHREATSAEWQSYSPDALAAARAAGRPVFVDFTAAWCLSCHVNEELVLDSSDVKAKFKSSGIVLMRADWTKYDPSITAALASVGRSGVPTYVIFPAGGAPDVLPELLSKGVVLSALDRDVK